MAAYTPPPAVIGPDEDLRSVTDQVEQVVLGPGPRRGWLLGLGLSFALLQVLLLSLTALVLRGTRIWGVMVPVAWGFAIINFVWWIGIGHAGTLISAVLLLLNQQWRMAIARFAEAMTLFAVACAGLFTVFHTGRPWVLYWMMPYPNTMRLWPQFRSPLMWDLFAISTYLTVSAIFWYVGLVPDLATMRDRAERLWLKRIYGFFAMGWQGSASQWHRYEVAAMILAGLATPLVVSVHTIVSFDFAASVVPGWHTTIFPPYFVAGAVYSGFAMVLTLLIPVRRFYRLETIITQRHLDNMAKVMLATGLIVAYGYTMEAFFSWYSGNPNEAAMMHNRMTGVYAPFYWTLILCNVVLVQLLWSPKVRRNVPLLFVLSLMVNVGMWLERFVIVITSLYRDFMPSAWDVYVPTVWDLATYAGSIGLFLTLLFLFLRVLPMISMFELRTIVHHERRRP